MDSEDRAAPPDLAAVRRLLDSEARAVRAWAQEEIAAIEGQRDESVRRLESAAMALDRQEPASEPQPQDPPRSGKPRRRRSKRPATTPAAARERREAVLRYLREQGAPRSRSEICRALSLSPDCVANALRILRAEAHVEQVGNRSATRYRARGAASPGGSRGLPVPREASVQGQILETLQERGWASLDELVQATGAPREEVLRECGVLVKEEEIHMGRREGRSVYVYPGAP
jgi:hypothetical protein